MTGASGAGPRWVPAPVPAAAAGLESSGFPAWLAALLARRGIADAPAAAGFLAPSLDQLHDPFRLAGMAAAVDRLLAARDRGERVAIVGDYDVDGISATALLSAVLGACHIATQPILPDRLREGYGFQSVHVERARELGCRLILTADCGSSSGEAVTAALAAGLDVVITDHHLPGVDLPAGTIQVNPRQSGCSYPFPDLAAAGLAFKLGTALAERCGRPLDPLPLLRIACLGTIADMVPLRGENRIIAALGLRALADARSHGLRALIQQAGLRPPFTAADVGYRLGPRLNAAGRLHDPNRALDLLLSRDPDRAQALAAELDGWNRERQTEESRVVDDARRVLFERRPLPSILVAWSADWHKGVVGVAAGRIAKECHRPTVLLSVEGSLATGSGRSVPDVALHAFLAAWQPRLRRFGGHAQAIGMSLDLDQLEGLRGEWERSAAASWEPGWLEKRHLYDLELAPRAITAELVAEIRRLEPFGQGNPQPLLRTGPLRLRRPPRPFGKGHLSAEAEAEDGSRVELLGWNWAARAEDLAGSFEVLAHPEIDGWHGGPVLRLVDSRCM
ncbi:MAG TPA: single-stranded-DNA-specific exonuclease RecJ [Thermoanaerobaculia bacterium]|jgi:single-stranded-DNA-specific exonuclease|nr:single-stranded-DNA-specific exonuclease RecJ [Thermoanaerobaculia bacterium]